MRFVNLRELLLRRASDAALQSLIKAVPDELIERAIAESLEKMSSDAKGRSIPPVLGVAVGHMLPHPTSQDNPGHGLENIDAALVHENLSHHLSHYSAALKAGHRQKADAHLNQVMRTIQFAERLGGGARHRGQLNSLRLRSGSTAPHAQDPKTGEMVKISHEGTTLISPTPWELNYTGSAIKPNGDPQEVAGCWGRKLNAKSDSYFPDYRYMEMRPHAHRKPDSLADEHAQSAYPFHELQVNGHYVNVDPQTPSDGKFASHLLDSHPAMRHAYAERSDLNPQQEQQFMDDHRQWLQSPQLAAWLETQANKSIPAMHERRRSEPIIAEPAASTLDPLYGRRLKRKQKDVTDGVVPRAPKWVKDAATQQTAAPADQSTAAPAPQPEQSAPPSSATSTATPSAEPSADVVTAVKNAAKFFTPEQIAGTARIPIETVKKILGK